MDDAIVTDPLQGLVGRLDGRMALRGDPGWDAARAAWNTRVRQHPSAVVWPAGLDDLRRVLSAARAAGAAVTTQPRGHGASTVPAGGVLLRPDAFDDLAVDVDRRIARVGAGVTWGRLLAALAGTGLVAPTGSSPSVSVVGFLLAGGHSWFSRSVGLGACALHAVEIMLADATYVRLVRGDGDLFWALGGAGGGLGIVTAVELELAASRGLSGGRLMFDGLDAAAVLAAVVEEGAEAPRGLGLHATVLRLPDVPAVPPALRGRTVATVDGVRLGDDRAADLVLDRIRRVASPMLDTFAPLGVDGIPSVAAEPTEPGAAADWSVTADLDAAGAAALVEALAAGPEVAAVQVRVLGGALAERDERVVAGAVAGAQLVHAVAPGEGTDGVLARITAATGPYATGTTVASFLGDGEEYGRAYDAAAIRRLRAVKAAVDPEGLIRGNRAYR